MAAMWGWPASPRPAGLGVWPSGHRLCVDVCDLLLESMQLAQLERRQGQAGRPLSGVCWPSLPLTLRLDACDYSRVLDH